MPGPDGPPRADPHRRRRRSGGGARRRPPVRDLSRRLSRPAAPSMSVRDPLSRFVETQLGPSDMIGLMYPLQSVLNVRMTRNHAAIVQGIQKFIGRKYDYTPMNDIEQQYANYPTETVERIRNKVSLSALKGLIIHMGTLKQGRKSLIVVSEGFTYMVPPQLRSPNSQMPAIAGVTGAGADSITEIAHEFLRDDRHAAGSARHLRRGQSPERVPVPGRSARAGGVRVRPERAVGRQRNGSAVPERDDGLAADAGRKHRRPRHREPQRSRGRACSRSCATAARITCSATVPPSRRPTASSTRSRSA